MNRLYTICFLVSLLAGCASQEPSPDARPNRPVVATTSEYFRSAMAMFFLEAKDPTAVKYAFAVDVLKPLPAGARTYVEFENPANPESPFISEATEIKGILHFGSPRVEALPPGRSYYARLSLVDANNQVISTHQQWIWYAGFPVRAPRAR